MLNIDLVLYLVLFAAVVAVIRYLRKPALIAGCNCAICHGMLKVTKSKVKEQ